MGIPFTGFAIIWMLGASGEFSRSSAKSPPALYGLFGGMFLVIGLCMLLSPIYALWKAGRVFYVVTDAGALIFERTWSLKIHSFDASGFGGFERVSRGACDGDILFQRAIERRGKGVHVAEVGFLGLPDFEEAEQALRVMMERHRGTV